MNINNHPGGTSNRKVPTINQLVMNAILAAVEEAGIGTPVNRLYELAAKYLPMTREEFDRVMRTPLGELL